MINHLNVESRAGVRGRRKRLVQGGPLELSLAIPLGFLAVSLEHQPQKEYLQGKTDPLAIGQGYLQAKRTWGS